MTIMGNGINYGKLLIMGNGKLQLAQERLI